MQGGERGVVVAGDVLVRRGQRVLRERREGAGRQTDDGAGVDDLGDVLLGADGAALRLKKERGVDCG